MTPHGDTGSGGDRELWAILVAQEPLDSRKWDYLDLQRGTFQAKAMLTESWSSGERVLIQVAQSLWNDGKVDLGYIGCAIGGRHLQTIIDAVPVRAGEPLRSDTGAAIRRIGAQTIRRGHSRTSGRSAPPLGLERPRERALDRPGHEIGRGPKAPIRHRRRLLVAAAKASVSALNQG